MDDYILRSELIEEKGYSPLRVILKHAEEGFDTLIEYQDEKKTEPYYANHHDNIRCALKDYLDRARAKGINTRGLDSKKYLKLLKVMTEDSPALDDILLGVLGEIKRLSLKKDKR